jgi:hypothetical protein
MTLSVSAYKFDQNGEEIELILDSDLAGVESTRHSFYAGALARQLGLTLLPRLAGEAMLEIHGAELVNLLSEVSLLAHNLPQDSFGEYWSFRLNNIRAAAELAQSHNGYVLIC